MRKFFIESKKETTPEAVFVKTLYLLCPKEKYDIVCLDGKDNLPKAAGVMIANSEEGGENLIIFDADSERNGGGYEKRRKQIEEQLQKMGVEASLFLFPNNHDDGDFETLLEHIARKDKHKAFFDCFSDYEKCLGNDYHHPNQKAKMFAYINGMKSLSGMKRRNLGIGEWLFDNPEYWDLDSDYLIPLKQFLK